MLQQTPSGPQPTVGVFLDPPYLKEDRKKDLYHGDADANRVAREAYDWAVAHGERFKIAYACGAAHFPVPKGWTSNVAGFAGVRNQEKRKRSKDMIIFSPACGGAQQELFRVIPDPGPFMATRTPAHQADTHEHGATSASAPARPRASGRRRRGAATGASGENGTPALVAQDAPAHSLVLGCDTAFAEARIRRAPADA